MPSDEWVAKVPATATGEFSTALTLPIIRLMLFRQHPLSSTQNFKNTRLTFCAELLLIPTELPQWLLTAPKLLLTKFLTKVSADLNGCQHGCLLSPIRIT